MNKEIQRFADFIIEWMVNKNDIELDRETEFQVVRMICDCVDLYETEEKKEGV